MSARIRRQNFSHAICSMQLGFSLIEILFALVITAILAGLASPAISSWVESAKAKAIQQQISSLLFDARYRALTGAQVLTVCHLQNDHCSSSFKLPLSAFVDMDRDAIRDDDEIIFREISADIPTSARLDWNRKGGFLRFWPSGGTGALTGSVTYCDTNYPSNDFRIVVARTGRIRIDTKDTRCN